MKYMINKIYITICLKIRFVKSEYYNNSKLRELATKIWNIIEKKSNERGDNWYV